jgi:hypothetical protein
MGNIVNPIGLDCDSEDREVTVAGLPFLLCGNDGYKSFERAGDTNCVNDLEQAGKANGRLSEIAAAAIRSAGDTGINPRPDPDKRIILSAGQPGAPVCTGRVLAQTQYR